MLDMHIQNLIDTGNAWSLEGSIGRACMAAIEAGAAVLGPTDHRDYWGNHIPSRHQVKPGTKGSVLFHHRAMHETWHADMGPGLPQETVGTSYKNCSPCRRLRAEKGS